MECLQLCSRILGKNGFAKSHRRHNGISALQRPGTEIAAFLALGDDSDSLEKILQLDQSENDGQKSTKTQNTLDKTRKCFDKLGREKYLHERTTEQVLRKLLKLLSRTVDVGLKHLTIQIGRIIGKIICYLYPLPEMTMLRLDQHGEGADVLHLKDEPFVNYGETVKHRTHASFFPKTRQEVQNVVKHARAAGKRVRVSGMRHSWAPIFGDEDNVLISLLPLEVVDTLSHVRSDKTIREILRAWNSELSFIELQEEINATSTEGGLRQARVRVGAATTNLEMLEWSLKHKWTLPVDIIAVMITYGGSNATLCHGAGLSNRSLSDLVLEVEFVNALGELQVVRDAELLKSVSGCFGLLGVVVSLTLRLDYMTYARWQPRKTPMHHSIPKPDSDDPEAFKRMVDLCKDSYYTEFFWFPNNGVDEGYWENCFKNDGLFSEVVELNDQLETEYQIASTFIFDTITDVLVPLLHIEMHMDPEKNVFHTFIREIFSKLISRAGVNALPEPDCPITTSLAEALHFRQGFHYISVREMELEIPIPSCADGSADWSLVQRAWWDAIQLIQQSAREGHYACDMALEMRIMGGSDCTLAPYRGNRHGTVCIEPVSTSVVPAKLWEEFKIKLANKWASYVDCDGTPLRVRPHWAKESPAQITWGGKTYFGTEFVKHIYEREFVEFRLHLQEVCKAGGYSLEEVQGLFSTEYFDDVFSAVFSKEDVLVV